MNADRVRQLTLGGILLVWAAAALPMAALAWVVVPALVPLLSTPPAIIFWLAMLLGSLWQLGLGLWILRRESGELSQATLRRDAWLREPSDSGTGQRRARAFLWLLPGFLVAGLTVGLGALLTSLAPMVLLRFGAMDLASYLWPAYMNVTELGSPEFAGAWPLLALVGLGWIGGTLFGEELLFRGVLLPRMAGAFGRWDWFANALLFGLYHLFKPWMIPFRLVGSLVIARLTRRYRSIWLSFSVRCLEGVALLAIVLIGVTSVDPEDLPSTVSLPWIERQPASMVPHPDGSGADLRGQDMSSRDLRESGESLVVATFDTRTIWPTTDRLPKALNAARLMELGKDPGLGVRDLHEQGIDGRGVGIAVVDQVLLVDHREYADRLLWYEEINPDFLGAPDADSHGPAVASIAAGETLGVAPGADLYYVGIRTNLKLYLWYAHNTAQAIRRIVALNDRLPEDRKIRVISISHGWGPRIPGYYDANAAVREAEAKGLLVVYSGSGSVPDGLGRAPLADPDSWESYGPGRFWAEEFVAGTRAPSTLLVPMEPRTVASAAGSEEYEYTGQAGISWAIPYEAGLYALAAQVDPAISPARFVELARETGRTVTIERDGRALKLGPIVDPRALVEALRRGQ